MKPNRAFLVFFFYILVYILLPSPSYSQQGQIEEAKALDAKINVENVTFFNFLILFYRMQNMSQT